LAGCCECGDEPSGSGATQLVSSTGDRKKNFEMNGITLSLNLISLNE
jgi:hypothetical protein